jgi:hypothetical protein
MFMFMFRNMFIHAAWSRACSMITSMQHGYAAGDHGHDHEPAVWTWARAYSLNMQQGHAAWISSMDTQQHAAWRHGHEAYRKYGHQEMDAEWTCKCTCMIESSVDMEVQHGDMTWRMDMKHRHATLPIRINMKNGYEQWTILHMQHFFMFIFIFILCSFYFMFMFMFIFVPDRKKVGCKRTHPIH